MVPEPPAQHVATPPLILVADGRRHEVAPGATFRIGRHPSNDLVLDAPSVSRFHAQVVWVDGAPLLQDLVSTNGTFVDGARVVGRAPLEPGAALRCGEVQAGEVEPGAAPALLDDDDDAPGLTLFADRDAEREGAFARNAVLLRVLLDLEDEQRTGTLELNLGMTPATLTWCFGRVVAATCGDRVGLEAIERVLCASVGGFRFSARYAPSDGSLDLSLRAHLRRGYWADTRRLQPLR